MKLMGLKSGVVGVTCAMVVSLALAGSASAGFTGFQLVNKGQYNTAGALGGPNVGLVDVWNLYALFDDPADSLNATFVLADDPGFDLMIHSSDLNDPFDGLGGGFWNWALGANTPVPSPSYFIDPAAADADTYLTIGLKSGSFSDGQDEAFFPPGGEAILNGSGILNGNGVIDVDFAYSATPNDEQTYPVPPVNERVLVLQFAVREGEHASGVWNIQWGNVGSPTAAPGPCPWDFDGNGDVGVFDLSILLGNWANPYGVPDLLALLADWGPCLGGGGRQASFVWSTLCQSDADCDDGDPCNGIEVCVDGSCLPGVPSPDCNGNGVLDACDIANGTSTDANGNGVPDDCDVLCAADIDNDGMVGINDFLDLLAAWGPCK